MPFPIIINKRKIDKKEHVHEVVRAGQQTTHTYSWRDLDASTVG
jgi:hypothetical protein